jgi:hypothetical protein
MTRDVRLPHLKHPFLDPWYAIISHNNYLCTLTVRSYEASKKNMQLASQLLLLPSSETPPPGSLDVLRVQFTVKMRERDTPFGIT